MYFYINSWSFQQRLVSRAVVIVKTQYDPLSQTLEQYTYENVLKLKET